MFLTLNVTPVLMLFSGINGSEKVQSKLNVVLIMLDDFRGGIGALGDKLAKTPNMDLLAQRSFYFPHVYASQALCAPSRNSMLTSRRPDTLLTYNFQHYWRTFVGNYTTLPQYFKENGYRTESVGKIFHHGPSSNKTDDFPYSWSNPTYIPSTQDYRNKPVCIGDDGNLRRNLICPVVVNLQPESTLPDIQVAKKAREFLNESHDKPFFLGVGFYKPHIPFKFPAEYLDQHDINNFKRDLIRPIDIPDVAWNPYNDLRERDDFKALNVSFPFGPVPSEFAAKIRQHYYASVTYVDDLIGGVLEFVDFSNTIVILTSDHAWSLGEHSAWSKFNESDHFAFSQYPRPGTFPSKSPDSDQPKLREIKIMGYSIRSKQFRYTAWIKFNSKKFKRNWRKIYGEELYDHSFDDDENINLAHRFGFEDIKNEFKQRLMQKFP
ncbi:CLUMA_CG002215, isoform A [Clunio marinus]|uniref:CLUMA_CG002215, isoform A n=1 Tax=Clunio marinus TaxID=568069 RepID=A0A1J1HQQ0_9DIPT|nr:CLUMA_CG002215, isoform A [Clunio marinus]